MAQTEIFEKSVKDFLKLTADEMRVLDALDGATMNNPIGMRELAEKVGLNERTLRKVFNSLVIGKGVRAGSTSTTNGGGYFMVLDEDSKKLACKQPRSRALTAILKEAGARGIPVEEMLVTLLNEYDEMDEERIKELLPKNLQDSFRKDKKVSVMQLVMEGSASKKFKAEMKKKLRGILDELDEAS